MLYMIHTGTFWGAPDTTVNFCESKYNRFYFIAEYYNTLSAGCYMMVGLLTFFFTRLKFLGKIVFLIGLGTMLLHATLRHWAQMCDEISLLLLSFYTIVELNPLTPMYIIYPLLICYILFSNNFAMFFFIFTIMQIVIAKYIKKTINNKNRKWIILYTVSFIAGSICWILDQICGKYGIDLLKDYQFHAWWHLLTATACGFGIIILHIGGRG